jgi:hypothetical protein
MVWPIMRKHPMADVNGKSMKAVGLALFQCGLVARNRHFIHHFRSAHLPQSSALSRMKNHHGWESPEKL